MIPGYVSEAVTAFGRQLGLQTLALNDRGAAGVDFENGISVRLEYADGALLVRAGVTGCDSAAALRRALLAAHPSAQEGSPLRVVRFARSGETAFVQRVPERAADAHAIGEAFQRVWTAADRARRAGE